MAKPTFTFEDFIMDVPLDAASFVTSMNDFLLENGCKLKIESAKSGYVASYSFNKRALINYVFRKSGLIVRIYGDFAHKYVDSLEKLPDFMLKIIDKAPACKRLIDPADCNQKCRMGYDFTINDSQYKKCQYSAFMFPVNDQSIPFIKELIINEYNNR